MKLHILVRLTPQVTTIICYHMKKVLLKKKIQVNMRDKTKTHILTKTIHVVYTC